MPSRIPDTRPGALTITDGGLETDLIFHDGLELPLFAAFPLLDDPVGREALERYYRRAIATADDAGLPFSLDTATWRANPDWAARLGYEDAEFERVNRDAAAFAIALRDEVVAEGTRIPILVCGVLGPRDDGYDPSTEMEPEEARAYHRLQLALFADAGVDYAAALTMTTIGEAAGIALAAAEVGLPVAIFFTIETDGRLPSGPTLREAIAGVESASDAAPAYYGVNCAHPDHLPPGLDEPWASRIAGYRANASRRSHAELDEAPDLDDGDPAELGRQLAELHRRVPNLTVLGGCCGTDDRHLRALAAELAAAG